jgi:hypothetical protein
MASLTINAVAPFAAMFVSRFTGARGPTDTSSTIALAASNGKKPAIRKGAEQSGGGAVADALRHASEKSNGGKTRT